MEALYGLLFSSIAGVALRPGEDGTPRPPTVLPAAALREVGFSEEEELVPYPLRAHPATRLLQYFHFPQ
jgi:type VI secretion system protein ImpG